MTELTAILAGEPWGLRPWEVGRLTAYQVAHVYFAERDSRGQVVRKDAAGAGGGLKSDEERFREVWFRRGLPDWRIRQLWEARLRGADEGGTAGRPNVGD